METIPFKCKNKVELYKIICLWNCWTWALLNSEQHKKTKKKTSLCTLCEWNKEHFPVKAPSCFFASGFPSLKTGRETWGRRRETFIMPLPIVPMVSKSPINLHFIWRFLSKTKSWRKVPAKRESGPKCLFAHEWSCGRSSWYMRQNPVDGFTEYQYRRIRKYIKNNVFER